MLRLLAAAYDDGYAFVQCGEQIIFIRPPFTRDRKVAGSLGQVERAVAQFAFTAEDRDFLDWAGLIQHLTSQILARGSQTKTVPSNAAGIRRLVERAPLKVVTGYLDRIERELFPNREWQAAGDLLECLLRNQDVRKDQSVMDRCLDLLKRSREGDRHDEGQLRALLEDDAAVERLFPHAAERYGSRPLELRSQVRSRGQVLLIGDDPA